MTQQSEYLGSIDGSTTIVISRRSDEVVLVLGGVEIRLSAVDASRLANILQSTASIPMHYDKPEPVQPSLPTKRATIAHLLEEGLLQVGTVLTMKHQNTDRLGTVTVDGKIVVDGYKEGSPSAAGQRVTGKTCNGWKEWRVHGGHRLADLRWMLRAKWFPGENHGYSESTAREKQMIAMGWVDYALKKRLNPGVRNELAIENYLENRQLYSDNRYKEKTLAGYRRHLRHWFNYYGGA